MSETATAQPSVQRTADVLLNLIVTLLTPMFLSAAGGDLPFARLAAAETLNAYRAETQADLITIAKIIAFGLATLASLSLSMADDLTISKMLRLHASAAASDRAEHRNRLLLNRARPKTPAPQPNTEPPIDEAALSAAVAETQRRTAENLAKFTPRTPTPTPPAPSATDEEKHYQATWAACTAAIAAETAASLPNLSPEERESAAIWVEVLNEVSNSFLTDGIPPRPKPGDLAGILRGT